MTLHPQEAERIAREYGVTVNPATPIQRIPRGVSGVPLDPLPPREAMQVAWRAMLRRRAFETARRRARS